MNIKEFIKNNSVDMTNARVDMKIIEAAEKIVGVEFGGELTKYVLNYGYLGYKYVELYGMNSRQGMESDMIKQTLYLHKYFPATNAFIAIENQGEGDYYLVDSNDRVYSYDTEISSLKDTGLSLFEYILKRFSEVKE